MRSFPNRSIRSIRSEGDVAQGVSEAERLALLETWGSPFFRSKFHSGELRPIIPYLFTDCAAVELPCRTKVAHIRTDGSLAPCFPMYSATVDWGVVGAHKFDVKQLDEMKTECTTHCLSTCNYILGHCYDTKRVIMCGLKQARGGFRSVSGGFDV